MNPKSIVWDQEIYTKIFTYQKDNVNEGNGNTNIPENFVAGFQRGHEKAVRYTHHKGSVHYQRTTLVQKLPSYYLEE